MSSSDLERTIRVLDDTRQIIAALNLYALAIDSDRYELFDKVFAPDVRADYNPPAMWTDREGIRGDMKMHHAPLDGSFHRITNHQVHVDGDRANSICYVVVRLLRQGAEFEMGGFYDDVFERTDAGWLIKTRFYRGSWWRGDVKVIAGPEGWVFEPFLKTLRNAETDGEVSYISALLKKIRERKVS